MDKYTIYTALVTPVFGNGEINYIEFERLIKFQMENQVDGVIIGGTTGFGYLYQTKLVEMLKFAVKVADGKIKIIAGISEFSYSYLTNLFKKLNELQIDGYLVLTPHYLTVSQTDLYHYYQVINDLTAHSIIIYHVPNRTAQTFKTETLIKCLSLSNVEGVKLASFDLEMLDRLVTAKMDKKIYLGDDSKIELMRSGFDGIISVFSNVNPVVVKAALKNPLIHQNLLGYFQIFNQYPNPVPIITVMKELGYQIGELPFPFSELPVGVRRTLVTEYQKLIENNQPLIVIIGNGKMGKAIEENLEGYHKAVLDLQKMNASKKELLEKAKVIIDFSHPSSIDVYSDLDYKNQPVFIIGTTGYERLDQIKALSKRYPVVYDTNFSKGIKIINHFLRELKTKGLVSGYEPTILEIHHQSKLDSPSGTALTIQHILGNDTPITSKRFGDIKGIHEVKFTNGSETIILGHTLIDRSAIVLGVIDAMRFLLKEPAGLYNYDQVLFDE